MQSVGGGKIGREIGSFLLGGGSSPCLGYAVLLNVPLSISRTGDLSDVVPVDETIRSIGSNGVYWLVGFDRYLYKFDGVNWTLLDDEGTTDIQFEAMNWNGEYWLIALRDIYAGMSILAKYDGVTYTILEESFAEDTYFFDLAWSPTVDYWIVVGSTYALPRDAKAWMWDGSTLTDISTKIAKTNDINFVAVDWFKNYWLLGGRHRVDYKQLKKYNPVTDTSEEIIPPRPAGDVSGSIASIRTGGNIALIGERYELGGLTSFYKWDGNTITHLTNFDFEVRGIDYAEGLFLIVGTRIVTNYVTYYYPRLRTYLGDTIETVTPPWGEGNRPLAIAYNPYIFG